MFLIILIELSLPQIIAKKVSKSPILEINYLKSALIISLSLSLFIMIILSFSSDFLAIYIFKNKALTSLIKASGLLLPLISLTSIYKGYLIGKKKLEASYLSQTFEEIFRLFFIILIPVLFTPNLINYGLSILISMMVGELGQLVALFLFSKTPLSLIKDLFNIKGNRKKELLTVVVPLTISKIITSFTYALEPIIYTNILLKINYSSSYILETYGVLQNYVNVILFLPLFFLGVIANFFLPSFSFLISQRKYQEGLNLFFKCLALTILISLFFAFFIYFSSPLLLKILFKTNKGLKMIKLLAFPYILYYLEGLLIVTSIGLELEKFYSLISIFVSFFRVFLIFVLVPKYLVIGIELAMLISILIVIIILTIRITITFKKNIKSLSF